MNTERELKACPFCDGTEITVREKSDGYWFVQCWHDSCLASIDDLPSRETAIKTWNTRPLRPEGGVREDFERLANYIDMFLAVYEDAPLERDVAQAAENLRAMLGSIRLRDSGLLRAIAKGTLPKQEGKGE